MNELYKWAADLAAEAEEKWESHWSEVRLAVLESGGGQQGLDELEKQRWLFRDVYLDGVAAGVGLSATDAVDELLAAVTAALRAKRTRRT